MDNNASEIRIGHATYLVEREFVGTVSREALLIDKIVDHQRKLSSKEPSKNQEIDGMVKQLALLESQTKSSLVCKLDPQLSLSCLNFLKSEDAETTRKPWACDLREKQRKDC